AVQGKGLSGEKLGIGDRMRLAGPAAVLPFGIAAGWLINNLFRRQVLDDPAVPPEKKQQSAFKQLTRAASSFGAFGSADWLANAAADVRYQLDPGRVFTPGPGLAEIAQDAGNFIKSFKENSPNTNTAERARALSFYNLVLQPAINAFSARYLPVVGPF